jgi:oxalate decarboxylase/phosphoglucose isomerase-like protein (cupin superfamily)
MTDGFVLSRGAGEAAGGNALLAGVAHGAAGSTFESVVSPGFDVGAHVHAGCQEIFYVIEGELDLLAFEPRVRTAEGWSRWESRDGRHVVRAGPGSFMFVPAGCPHAFSNPGPAPARMVFQTIPAGHEQYLRELSGLFRRGSPPDAEAVAELRRRHDIEQLTPMQFVRPS